MYAHSEAVIRVAKELRHSPEPEHDHSGVEFGIFKITIKIFLKCLPTDGARVLVKKIVKCSKKAPKDCKCFLIPVEGGAILKRLLSALREIGLHVLVEDLVGEHDVNFYCMSFHIDLSFKIGKSASRRF